MTITNLKMEVEEKLKEYAGKHDGAREFELTIGTKVSRIAVNKIDEVTTPGGRIRKNKTALFVVEMKLENSIEDIYFVSTKEKEYQYYKSSELQVERDEKNILVQFLVSYWLSYTKFKKSQGIFFDFNFHYPEIVEAYNRIFDDLNCESFNKLNRVLEVGEFKPRRGILSSNRKEKIQRAEKIEKEIEIAMLEIPTFVFVENEHNHNSSLYKINGKKFYYEGETFKIAFDGEKLSVKGASWEAAQYFDFEEGILVDGILKYVYSKNRLRNLTKPPIKFLKELVEKVSGFSINEEKYVEIVQRSDDTIGIGETEIQAKEAIKYTDKYLSLDQYERKYTIEVRKRFKEITNDEYILARIKTDKFYWYLLISRDVRDFNFVPNEIEEIPDEIFNGIREILSRTMLKD